LVFLGGVVAVGAGVFVFAGAGVTVCCGVTLPELVD